MRHLIFVYGTLKKGCHNNHHIAGSECLGSGFTVEKFAMYQDRIPYVVRDVVFAIVSGLIAGA